jgi:hypothetical protein
VRLKQCLEEKKIGCSGQQLCYKQEIPYSDKRKNPKALRPMARIVPNALRCSRVQRAGGRGERVSWRRRRRSRKTRSLRRFCFGVGGGGGRWRSSRVEFSSRHDDGIETNGTFNRWRGKRFLLLLTTANAVIIRKYREMGDELARDSS